MYNYEILRLAYDIYNVQCPPYFYNYLSDNTDNILCTRNGSYLQPSSIVISKPFQFNAKQLWLSLSEDLRMLDSRNVFKLRVFDLYLEKQRSESIPIHDEDSCDFSCIESAIINAMSCPI